MAYRTVSLANGDTVRISESVLRGAGPEGPIGPAGPPGTATTIRGYYPTIGDLRISIPIGNQGDSYITLDDGHLWSWDTFLPDPDWVDCGRIVGPAAVMSIGAKRTRATSKGINSGTVYTCQYEQTENDGDSLGGFVLSPTLCTDVDTVVYYDTDMYYLVLTTFKVAQSVFNPIFDVAWVNTAPDPDTASAPGNEQAIGTTNFIVQHMALLKTEKTDVWQLRIKPSDTVTISEITTTWTRVGGGPGPVGPHGPAPNLVTGTVTKIPAGGTPTYDIVETTDGNYTINVGLVTGDQGVAGSGYTSFNLMAGVTDSEADPGQAPDIITDQAIPAPDGASSPVVPWYLRSLITSIYRKLVGRLTTTERTARGTPPDGEVVFDTTLHQLLLGTFDRSGANPTWQRVTTTEYGQSASVYHDAATTRVDGSIYFKYDS